MAHRIRKRRIADSYWFLGLSASYVDSEDDINAWGHGFRWLAVEERNVWIGIDIAEGPEDVNYYIQMVHPW